MIDGRIYFQRANQFWTSTESIVLNAYFNILHYVKYPIDEKMLNIALGGHLPCYKKNMFDGKRIEPEKHLSYIMGLYYEEYYHDCKETFFSGIHKNLKMRIALVIVYGAIKQDDSSEKVIPMVCCGANENKKTIIVINPFNGEYEEKSLDECFVQNGKRKFVILNVPGMVKMKGIDKKASIVAAMQLYIKRFFFYANSYMMDMTGEEFFRFSIKGGIDLNKLPGFLLHRKEQLKWLYDMLFLLQEIEAHNFIPVVNKFINLYEKSVELDYEEELDYLTKIKMNEYIRG